MKKKIDFELTADEKRVLKEKKVSVKMLQCNSLDEVAQLLKASPQRTKEIQALADFQGIPSLGIGFAKELIGQGYYGLNELHGKTAVELFDAYEKHCGCRADPCVEDSYRLLVHFIEHRDVTKRWWDFTKERKAYRERYGFPADRPALAWYETGQFPKMKAFKARSLFS